MTVEELETAIRAGDAGRCGELLQGVSEADRRAAAPMALKWHQAATGRRMNELKFPELVFPSARAEQERVGDAASVALLGTATLGELKKLGWSAFHVIDAAYDALRERNPPWLAEWADWALVERRTVWPYVRRMVREGRMPPPTVDAYITAMISHFWPKSPLSFLRADPTLLEHEIWRLFEVEGGGEDSLAARDKSQHTGHGWAGALRTLAEERALDRQRLLTASLEALQRDFSQVRAGWFSRFHEMLNPTVEERAERLDPYLALLGSPISPSVSFALKALACLDQAGRLPADRFIEHVAPALGAREKGSVSQALKLLMRALKNEPSLQPAGVRVATEALVHESAEVQGLVLDLVEKYGDPADPVLASALSSYLGGVAPSQRPRLEAWLGNSAHTPTPPETGPTREELRAAGAELPAELRELAGVEAALELTQVGSLALPPLDLRDLRIPRLDPTARLQPVRDLDELLQLYLQVLENEAPPDDVERVLDGVSRLCAERPTQWEARVAPLRKRAETLAERARTSLRLDLCGLARAWLSGEVTDPPTKQRANLSNFLSTRVLAISVRAAHRQAGPLLGAPTHAGGWIAPEILVERVRALQALSPATPDPLSERVRAALGTTPEEHLRFETALALLRLAPEGRAEALAAASDLRGELGEAVRYALGGEGTEIGPTPALWAAAARARQPWGEIPALAARHPGLGPGAAGTVRARLEFRNMSSEHAPKPWFSAVLVTRPSIPRTAPLDLPSVLVYTESDRENLWERTLADLRWCATLWPMNREGWSTAGAFALLESIDRCDAQSANAAWLEVLLDPDTHLGTMERQMLLFGLGAKDPTASGLAVDIAIAAIRDGRLTGPSLGETLCETLPLQGVKGARLAKTLQEVVRSSPSHVFAVKLGLEKGMAAAKTQKPADLGALLELLQELCVETGSAVADTTSREFLQSFPGSGKTAKLAAAVLALPETEAATTRAAAGAEAVAGRLSRACRWAIRRDGVDLPKPK